MLETTPVRNLPQVANLWEFVFFYIPCKYENDTLFVEISSVCFGLLQNCESEFFVYALHYDLSYSEWLYVLIWSNSIGQHSDYLPDTFLVGVQLKLAQLRWTDWRLDVNSQILKVYQAGVICPVK